MTKAEMISFLADKTHCSKVNANKIIRTLPDMIKAALEKDGRVMIPGLGTFSVKMRRAHKGRNPRTGEAIVIPEKKIVSFKASKGFDKSFNGDAE